MSRLSRPLWHSISFRLALGGGLIAVLAMLAVLVIIYVQTVGVMQRRVERRVAVVAQKLQSHFDAGGAHGVAAAIDGAMADGHDSDEEIYLLMDRDGWRVTGNLNDAGQAVMWADEAPTRRQLVRAGKVVTAHIVAREFPDGSLLLVGHDWREQEIIKAIVIRASVIAGAFAVVMVLGGAIIFRHVLERSVGAIRRTAVRISAGKLQERIAPSGARDEFALLELDINAMLDRIQALVEGIRHASNTIAHDLRAPLARVIGHLRDASDDSLGNSSQQQRAIEAATAGAEGLATMFAKLLRIAEIEAGVHRHHFGSVALHDLIDDMTDLYEAAAHAQGTTLLRLPADTCTVRGDRDLLAGALANLIDNALQHGGPGRVVRVGVWASGERVLITVQDDGPGVPSSELGRIGSRFHRLSHGGSGHGLGLASVRAIAIAHEGHLFFSDAKPGLAAHLELPVRSLGSA